MSPVPGLLPRQSTPLERAIDQSLPRWDGLVDVMQPAGTGPVSSEPAALRPWLAAEWGVADFAAYFDTTDKLMDAALPWMLERGSAAAVRRVLGWLGYDRVLIEEDGPYLHIDLGRVAPSAQFQDIARVVRSSIPTHVRFYRVFHTYDLRHLMLDGGQPLDCALLDNDSGVWGDTDTGEPVKASFSQGRIERIDTWQASPIAEGYTAWHGTTLPQSDRLQLDAWRLDSFLVVDSYAGVGAIFTGTCNASTPGQPIGYAAGYYIHGRIGLAAWAGSTLIQAQTSTSTALLPSTNQQRGWTGTWDATPWRPCISSKQSTQN
ncbi:phage tail protein [Verminephrobacter aporrectodeae subsp. tuberculatae]|uniref:Phage tail protein n=1 Tax=Verminephrobacter aporrectodeae subsp. tuberculatae TaxID=1110392 RepID=A0ABT3KQF5_9BURK|nr:phage tail protein [Verminephrobacter aporrectodeae]MCW5320549.1 phage tail protein [Verminephrobacter aporrectodeae subsp. tuberculatae]